VLIQVPGAGIKTVPGVTEAKVTLLRERWDPSWMKR